MHVCLSTQCTRVTSRGDSNLRQGFDIFGGCGVCIFCACDALQEERAPMEQVVNTTFPVLLPMLQQLLAAPATSGTQASASQA